MKRVEGLWKIATPQNLAAGLRAALAAVHIRET